MFTLEVFDKNDECLSSQSSDSLAELDVRYRAYEEGDYILVTSDVSGIELEAMLDISLPKSIIYLSGTTFRFDIPFSQAREPYGQHAFTGDCHWGYIKAIDEKSRKNYVCLSQNSMDLEDQDMIFPHASTNSGATNPRFLSRNAIDGIFQTCHHGRWPYQSFGINGRDDAWLKVDFGREVLAEDLLIYLRADFPHDAWWDQITVELSNGTRLIVPLTKTGAPQKVELGEQKITWLKISDLKKAECEALWPALSQLQVMGRLI